MPLIRELEELRSDLISRFGLHQPDRSGIAARPSEDCRQTCRGPVRGGSRRASDAPRSQSDGPRRPVGPLIADIQCARRCPVQDT